MKQMAVPTLCPTNGPAWFVDNYPTICRNLIKGKTTSEIAEILKERGVKAEGQTPISSYLSTKLSGLISQRKFPDFPQMKGYSQRTTRRSERTRAWSGHTEIDTPVGNGNPTTTVRTDGSLSQPVSHLRSILEDKKETVAPRTFSESNPSNIKLDAIERLLQSSLTADQKLRYIRVELQGE